MPARITDAEARRFGLDTGKPKKRSTKFPAVKPPSALLCILWEWSVMNGYCEPVAEYRFHPVRKWRFDFAFILDRLALEIDGGIWTQGRHTRGKGYLGDIEKMNAAAALGWRIVRCVPADVESGKVFQILESVLEANHVP